MKMSLMSENIIIHNPAFDSFRRGTRFADVRRAIGAVASR